MHELSIALNILDIVQSTCLEQGYTRVDRVRVQIGKASGVMTDPLVFSFDCAKAGTVAEHATLDIDEVPLGGRCRECRSDFRVGEPYVLNCPACGGRAFDIISGHELQVVELEVDA